MEDFMFVNRPVEFPDNSLIDVPNHFIEIVSYTKLYHAQYNMLI